MPHRTVVFFLLLFVASAGTAAPPEPLAGTKPLGMHGDLASQMVAGIDKFLLREIDRSVERRAAHWKRDFSSPAAYEKSVEPNRQHLRRMIGVESPSRAGQTRPAFEIADHILSRVAPPIRKNAHYSVMAVRW